MTYVESLGLGAHAAARKLGLIPSYQKVTALHAIADALMDQRAIILKANAGDVEQGRSVGMAASLLDSMLLNEQRLQSIANDVRSVADLPDPVGERFDVAVLPNGLHVHKRRVPFGVVAVIYEARPNVTIDIASLCIQSGNAAILRGGKEIGASCIALVGCVQEALRASDLPAETIQAITEPDRALVEELLRLDRYVDIVIPRGGAALHAFCREKATVPVITGGIGVCHVYVDHQADLDMVVPIVRNAKLQRPSVCNALDTLLVHRDVAAKVLPMVARDLLAQHVELRVDQRSMLILQDNELVGLGVVAAQPDDFGTEFMALILSVRVVDSLDEALDHIAAYGDHSDAIITENAQTADHFVAAVDSAAVFVNASTRFNDGGQLGLGAEVAVSTQKMHVRGPMALRELTTYKWVIEGRGHIRQG